MQEKAAETAECRPRRPWLLRCRRRSVSAVRRSLQDRPCVWPVDGLLCDRNFEILTREEKENEVIWTKRTNGNGSRHGKYRTGGGEIQQKIFQLGQMYYTDHKENDSGDEKYYPMIDLINKLDQNRNGFYKNKMRLEGQMMCVNCGAVIPYGSMFCNVCGKKADEKQDGAGPNIAGPDAAAGNGMAGAGNDIGERRCGNCGAVLEPDSMFCIVCGQKIEA